jgi:hypothetical protein
MAVTLKKEKKEQEKPGAYQSAWQSQSQAVTDKVMSREGFSYDMEKDPLYQQYKQQYTQQGLTAMQDTMGQAAALTGGYGNSYAATAGQQAYQSYLQQLNAVVPDLYDLAMQKYQMEGDDLYRQADYVQKQEQTDYDRYLDSYAQWVDARDYAYQQSRDDKADSQWQQTFEYGKKKDEVANNQWKEEFEYGKKKDEVANNQWKEEFEYGKKKDEVANNQWKEEFEYGKEKDEIANDQWKEEFEYEKSVDEQKNAQAQATENWSTNGYSKATIQAIQKALGVTADGVWGPKTIAAARKAGFTTVGQAAKALI